MIYTVFSTTDSHYMQWQSELLEYSWKKVGQPGELIRLVSTDRPESAPQHEYARTVTTRQWKVHPLTGDDYAPYNKPAALLEWIQQERPEGTILLVDPDCVFRKRVDQEVSPGQPIGQHWIDGPSGNTPPFGLGSTFDKLRSYCANDRLPVDPVMIPNLIHTRDMQRIALRWLEVTGLVRQHVRNHQDNPMWESDMFGFVIASAEFGLRHQLGTLGICTNWSPEKVVDAPMIHYCQSIQDADGETLWSKGTYRPWQPVPEPSRATTDYGHDLLSLINEYVEQQSESSESYPRRRQGVDERRLNSDQTELVPPGSSTPLVLNFTAEAIWLLCDGGRSVQAITDELAARYNMAASDILPDIRHGLHDLKQAGVLEWEDVC